MKRCSMNSQLRTRTRGPSRGKQKCRSSRPRGPYLSTPVTKETTAWGTCSEQLEPRTKKQPKLLQRKETNKCGERWSLRCLELLYCWPRCRCGHITHFRRNSTSTNR